MSTAAASFAALFGALLGEPLPLAVRFWDGSTIGAPDGPATIVLRSPAALRRALYSPNELGFGRAYVTGELDIDGDLFAAMRALVRAAPDDLRIGARTLARTLGRAARLGVIGRPLPPPPEEARLTGWLHSRARDAAAVAHHYDVSNDFYRLVLGSTMTYSCARFESQGQSLDDAQQAKYELICRKLGLAPGQRLLDVGCGWGGMVLHAAARHGIAALGVTLSRPQEELARKRAAESGLDGQVEIRLQDYRDLAGSYDAVSSIGMFEHVGRARTAEYFTTLAALLRPGGRLLNHAISTPEGASFDRRSFVARYVFPDGELQDVGSVCLGMQKAGLEVRDVRLYMTGSAVSFEEGEISVHQVLGVKPDQGASGMALTRRAWDV